MVTTWLPHIQIMCKIPCAENSPISLHGIRSNAPFFINACVSDGTSQSSHTSCYTSPELSSFENLKNVHLFAILSETDFNLCMQNDQVYFL